jgi:tetratricopeptide (TPR) repeat protein
MPHPKRSGPSSAGSNSFPPGSALGLLAERTQLDFELDFYGKLLAAVPDFADALRAQACNLTMKGRMQEGLAVDEKLVAVRPTDPTAHYNLACRYALLKQRDKAITSLRKAVELGYRDFAFMQEDHDLDSIRKDPRFRKLLKEFQEG